MKEDLEKVIEPLLNWYEKSKRILPWRKNKNPYSIWISEIMLQQTRIEAVKEYYKRFMKEIPSIQVLANIDEEKLLKLWEGLGYYNRARNLQKAAKLIEKEYQGKMPDSYKELITLPGIGEYTAGAIASIAYDEPVTAIDGNVLRVISRLIASTKDVLLPETKKDIQSKIEKIMPKKNAGNFNEALMELGELVCLPNGEPECQRCPLKQYCKAYKENLTAKIPVREKKIKRKKEEKTVFILISSSGKIAIKKREQNGVLKGMYELPNVINKWQETKVEEVLKEKWNIQSIQQIEFSGEYKHIFTHIEWHMYGYEVKVRTEDEKSFLWVSKEELETVYAIPTAFKQFIRKV